MNNNKNEVVFTGYLAEVIRLQAEKKGITPEAYILSFFEKRCNAPRRGENARRVETKPKRASKRPCVYVTIKPAKVFIYS